MIDPEEGGWELDAARGETQGQEEEFEDAIDEDDTLRAHMNENDLWVRNSQFTTNHTAAGSAMQVSTSFLPVQVVSIDLLGPICIVT